MPPITESVRQSFAFRLLCLVLLAGVCLAVVQVVLYSSKTDSLGIDLAPQANSAEITAASVSDRHIISRNGDGLFYIDGLVNGVKVRFAVDTGASVVVLNAADAKRAGWDGTSRSHHRIRTASGFSPMTWRQADNVTIEGRALGPLDIAVMEKGPKVSLLGLNALSRLGPVTMQNDKLIIGYR